MLPIKRSVIYKVHGSRMYARIRWAGREMDLSTGYTIDTDKWDGRRCAPGSRHGDARVPAAVINRHLQALEDAVNSAFTSYEDRDEIPTAAQLRDLIKGRPADEGNFERVFLQFLHEGSAVHGWQPATVASVRSLLKKVLQYRPSLSMGDVSPEFVRDFTAFLYSPEAYAGRAPGKTLSNIVVRKYLRVLRWFLRWAADKGLAPAEVTRSWTSEIKTIPRPVIYLTREEIALFEGARLPHGSHCDVARDYLVFCSYTSLRISDAMALRRVDVYPDAIAVVTKKTGTPVVIDLNTHSRAILDKYASSGGDRALPPITLNRLNLSLKKVGKMLGIDTPVPISQYHGGARVDTVLPKWQLLSSHTGRRSFVVNALSAGIPVETVMKWTGHTDYQAMRPYIDIATAARASAMRLLDH